MTLTEDKKADLRKAEPEFLRGLVDAAPYADELDEAEVATIWIPPLRHRPGFSFRVHALPQARYKALLEKNTVRAANPDLGGFQAAGSVQEENFWADVIVETTLDEDARDLWHNQDLLRAYSCRLSRELVLKLIPKTGWLQDVMQQIDTLGAVGQGLPSPSAWEQQQRQQQRQIEVALGN